jgi:GWxTD domain-containing protein
LLKKKEKQAMKINYLIPCFILSVVSLASCISTKTAVRNSEAQRAANQQSIPEPANEPTLVGVTSKFLDKDSTQVRVFVYIDAVKGESSIDIEEFSKLYTLNYVMYSDYGTRDRLAYGNVPMTLQNLTEVDKQIVAQFDIKKPGKDYGVMLIEISQIGTLKKVLNDLPISFNNQRDSEKFGVFEGGKNVPLRRHFVSQNQPVEVHSLSGKSTPLYVYYYRHGFEAAPSPMNTVPKPVTKNLKIDSAYTIMSNQSLSFSEQGLYFILSDTTQTEGMGILVTDDRYPKLTQPEKLTEPLLYMSTNQEVKEIEAARDEKKALDKFWLSLMNGNPELARQVIRYYYQRVEDANRLFTSYKEGWKTDKGMIFIILGPPDKVQRSKDKEVWVYDQKANATNVNFTFNKRTNQFVDDHYELVRYVEYQPIWYPVVEAWRNGAIR